MESVAAVIATGRNFRGSRWIAAAAAIALVLSLAAMAAGCGTSESPSEVAEQAISAIAAKDCDRILELTATERIEAVYEGDREKALEDCREGMAQTGDIEGVGDITFEITVFEVLEEQVDGSNATVKYRAVIKTTAEGKDEEQTDEDEIHLTKEGSTWKVASLGA